MSPAERLRGAAGRHRCYFRRRDRQQKPRRRHPQLERRRRPHFRLHRRRNHRPADFDPAAARATRRRGRHSVEDSSKGERVDHFETIRVRKDGRRVDISVTVSPIHDAAGKVIGTRKSPATSPSSGGCARWPSEASRREGRVPRRAVARAAHAAEYRARLRAHAAPGRQAVTDDVRVWALKRA